MIADAPPTLGQRTQYEETSWNSLVPSEEIREFVASAREHLASIFPTATIRAAVEGRGIDLSLWSQLVDQGYTSVGIPERLGGDGTLTDLTALLEVAGGALVPLPILATAVAAQTMITAALDFEEFGEDFVSQRRGLAIAGDSSSSIQNVFDGHTLTRLALLRAEGDRLSLEWYDVSGLAGSPDSGVSVDGSRAWVGVDLGAADRLGRIELDVTLDQALAAARVCVSADLVGIASTSLDRSIAHVLARHQFGRPLGAFQAIKHMLADVYVGLERARSLTLGAAAAVALDPRGESANRLAQLAKASSAEIAIRSAAVRIQLMGAMGLTYEADAHLYLRRAQETARFLGGASELYVRVAEMRLAGSRSGGAFNGE